MELLVFLCSRAGQVVPKQEVLDAVWGGRFVSDETVKGSFYQLRKLLGDNPREPRFIETLPKRGYRVLVEPVLLDREPESAECESLYQKGRAALSEQPSAASLKQARLYFERATQSYPTHAAAFAALARTYILMVSLGLGPGSELLPRAKASASRAQELDPKLAEAHFAQGVVQFVHDHAFAAAENAFRLAIQLQPDDPLTHNWYARLLSAQGRHDEAIAEARRAITADPLSLAARRDLLDFLLAARRYEETIAEAHQLFDMNPNAPDVHLGLVWVYHLQKQDRLAFEEFVAGLQLLGIASQWIEQARATLASEGLAGILRAWIQMLEQQAAMGQKTQIDLLVLNALLGNNDRCFELLDLFCNQDHPYVLSLAASPIFDGLRSDSRYPSFINRLGLQPPA